MSANPTAKRKAWRGLTTLDVGTAVVILFLVALAMIDVARIQFFRSRLQYAISQIARSTAADRALDHTALVAEIQELSGLRDLATSDVVLTSTDPAGNTVAGSGRPGDLVTIEATYRVDIVAPYLSGAFADGHYVFTCATTYRNESFAPSVAGAGPDASAGDVFAGAPVAPGPDVRNDIESGVCMVSG